MEKQSEQNNPWSNLMTISRFDRGNNNKTTIRLDNRTETQGNSKLVPSATRRVLIESLIKQMCTMWEGDTVKRDKLYFMICNRLHETGMIDTSYNSMEVENIRSQYEHALYKLVMVARAATGCETPLNVPNCLMAEWSRYRREFKEKEFIAAGGFSNVFKALHLLDGIEYAVKKIVVRSGQVSTIKQHLEEVKVLAKLNHPNIVAYKTAWIEPTLVATIVPSLPNIEGEGNKNQIFKHQTKRLCEINYFNNNNQSISDSNNSNENNGNDTSLKSDKTGQKIIELSTEDSSDIVSFRNDSEDRKSNTDHSKSNVNSTDITDSTDASSNSNSNKKISRYDSQRMDHCFATLYIQMALCEKTLHQWLKEKDDPSSQMTITTIFTQILQGVNHIHSIGMVHHDIKPSNIFITAHFQIQLGDFGLACPLQRKNHDTIIGTRLYAAPEQLKGECNPKSDIYSLGIVLLELLIHAKTQMELCHTIEEFKKGRVPTSLTTNYPQWTQIICQLIQEDPNKRPSTDKLLLNLREDKDTVIAQLKDDIVEKNMTIKKLEEHIAELQAYITKLETP
ncbi:PREDICTED: eukaryotic translation initiation factor 2-alpha kinase 1-like [Polistes canadensis]|uniref:eukaryotic translation initiation factor 2-alpha kinase 1-like n=1 Tax=Polistes canadensis TaxID=91411 RepID=UPI000718DCEF|nr:PREDICTED: eukaryotic translation initiation factor 2-alpha kinase 1-like [Polistes canadensis]